MNAEIENQPYLDKHTSTDKFLCMVINTMNANARNFNGFCKAENQAMNLRRFALGLRMGLAPRC
jgi:hypothetical protein